MQEAEDQRLSCGIVTSGYDKEATPMKSQHHGCLNKIETTPKLTTKSMRKSHRLPPLDEELLTVNNLERKNYYSPG